MLACHQALLKGSHIETNELGVIDDVAAGRAVEQDRRQGRCRPSRWVTRLFWPVGNDNDVVRPCS
jgi:hypothetical protein